VSVTWAQLHERIGVVVAALRRRGVKAGDPVAIMMTNRPRVPRDNVRRQRPGRDRRPGQFPARPAEIAYILTDCGASLLLVDATTGAAAAAARAVCAQEIGFVSTGATDGAARVLRAGSMAAAVRRSVAGQP
jgi:fatty-acyl-CoA synthase